MRPGGRSDGGPGTDVDEVMDRETPVCLPESPLQLATLRLGHGGIGCLPVVKDLASRELVGILTRADLERAAELRSDFAHTPVARFMSDKPRTCWPGDSLEAALAVMRAYGVCRLPVVEADGRLRGVLSYADLLRGGVERDAGEIPQGASTSSRSSSRRASSSAGTCMPDEPL